MCGFSSASRAASFQVAGRRGRTDNPLQIINLKCNNLFAKFVRKSLRPGSLWGLTNDRTQEN